MKQGYFERHIHRMSQFYREKLERIRSILLRSSNILIHGHETGLHFLIEVITDEKEDDLMCRLKNAHIHVVSLIKKPKNLYTHPTFIIGYSGISLEDIDAYFNALVDAIQKK